MSEEFLIRYMISALGLHANYNQRSNGSCMSQEVYPCTSAAFSFPAWSPGSNGADGIHLQATILNLGKNTKLAIIIYPIWALKNIRFLLLFTWLGGRFSIHQITTNGQPLPQ